MTYKFTAANIEILNFSPEPDSSGLVISSHAIVDFKKTMRVYYGPAGSEKVAGHAKLRRTEGGILADLILYSNMENTDKAFAITKRLYPATSFYVYQFRGPQVLHIEIVELFLTKSGNDDLNIKPLGERLNRKLPQKELH